MPPSRTAAGTAVRGEYRPCALTLQHNPARTPRSRPGCPENSVDEGVTGRPAARAAGSHAKLVFDAGAALDIRREAGALLGEIARAVVSRRRGVVGQIENPPRAMRHVRLRGMR